MEESTATGIKLKECLYIHTLAITEIGALIFGEVEVETYMLQNV